MTTPRIATPCHESWDAMTPAGQGRHCAACDKTVVDVSAMAPSAARDFLHRDLPLRLGRGERVCVRAHADRAGRLQRPGARRRLLTNGLAGMLALAGLAGLGAGAQAAEDATPPVDQVVRMTGEVSVRIGDVVAPHPVMATATDTATGLRIDAFDNGLVSATGADGAVRWNAVLATLGAPRDVAALACAGDGTVRVTSGAGTDLVLDLATGARHETP